MGRKHNKDLLLQGVLITALILSQSCCDKKSEPVKTILKGTFVSIGNVPFNNLAFRTENGKTYRVMGGENRKYSQYQGRVLTIEGMVGTFTMITADSKYKRKVLYIKDFVIIKEQ